MTVPEPAVDLLPEIREGLKESLMTRPSHVRWLIAEVEALRACYPAVAADALEHKLCHMKLMGQVRRAEKAERERDEARAACRSVAVLLRSIADQGADVGTLLAAARDLDDIAGPAVNNTVISPVNPNTTTEESR
jgi:hypothetical protein